VVACEPLLTKSYDDQTKDVNLDTFLMNYKTKYHRTKRDTLNKDSIMEKNLRSIRLQNKRVEILLQKKSKKSKK
jgi:hypothetical protein